MIDRWPASESGTQQLFSRRHRPLRQSRGRLCATVAMHDYDDNRGSGESTLLHWHSLTRTDTTPVGLSSSL